MRSSRGDQRRHRIQHRRLAGTGTAGNQHVAPAFTTPRSTRRLRRHRAEVDQLVHVDRGLGEFPDRQDRAVDRQRRNDRVDAAAVGQTRIDHRRALVDPASDRTTILPMIRSRCRSSAKRDARLLQLAAPLDEDRRGVLTMMSVIDGSFSSGSSGPRPEQLVEDILDQLLALGEVERVVDLLQHVD